MKTNTSSSFAANVAKTLVIVATSELALAKDKAALASSIAAAYASVKAGDAKAFADLFGNGEAPKSRGYLPGSIAVATRESIAKVAKPKQVMALNILKTRLSECRRAFKNGLVLGADETVQAAIKRIPKEIAKADKEAQETVSRIGWSIPAGAEMKDVVEQFSIWIAKHPDASRAVASSLADCLPISVKANRKAS